MSTLLQFIDERAILPSQLKRALENLARIEVLTAVFHNMSVFWDIRPCRKANTSQSFKEYHCLHFYIQAVK
jgi:hypothetical protein